MLKYLIFITIGILLYLLLNIYNTFSIGVPVTDLNEIFPDADYPNKVSSDEDPFGAGIPRVFYEQGLRLSRENRMYDVGWYYGNDTGRIFISAINIPIIEPQTGYVGQTPLELPMPTYINYNMHADAETINLNQLTYQFTEPGEYDTYYRLRNTGNYLLIYTLDNRIVISNIRHPDRRAYRNIEDWCAVIPEGIPPEGA